MPKFVERKSCPKCNRMVAFKTDGDPYKHTCTGELILKCDGCGRGFVPRDGALPEHDCTPATPQQCSELKCTCEGNGGPEHELAIIGAFDDPTDTVPEKGPWFGAMYGGRCSSCEESFAEGDRIRADGQGGYECEDCGDDDLSSLAPETNTYQAQASAAAKRHVEATGPHAHSLTDAQTAPVVELRIPAAPGPMLTGSSVVLATGAFNPDPIPAAPGPMPAPDDAQSFMDFEDPTAPAEKPRKINVSGQPEPNRDWQKRYIVKDPATGDFRWQKNGKAAGITRVTTFNKAAQDSKAINDWGKRNVVIGASLRPDILRRAHGLVHETGREELDRIVADLDVAAGGKVSADEGTYLHGETEYIDAGVKTWRDSPAAYQQDLKRYVEALEEAGLEPVPGLIERTTMISEFGGVCGTFDRIFYHRPSGSYVIGDLKTGKTMKYAMDETQTQLWCYAHGVNTNGIYDWNTDKWQPLAFDPARGPVRVREDVGVIVHMPVQGPEAGTVNVLKADLVAGRVHAELCHTIRSRPKHKPVPWAAWVAPVEDDDTRDRPLFAPGAEAYYRRVLGLDTSETAPVPTLDEMFAAVRDKEHATELWRDAKRAGIEGVRLNELIQIARDALVGKG
jgi:hypothetical protein